MVEIKNSVTAVIAERIKARSRENSRKDSFKVGLVIEGGGMRGVISAGMVIALQSLGSLSAIDGIYSVSAGSCNAAYFVSGQTPEGTTIYYEDINNQRFINPVRFLEGKPIVDIPYLTYEVMKNIKPLNWWLIKESGVPLHVYTTEARTLKTLDLCNFSSQEEILDALHWSSRMPIFAGMPLRISNGQFYTDGMVLNGGIAINEAISDGCTHILVLLTKPEGTIKKKRSFIEYLMTHTFLRRFPELVIALDREPKVYSEILKLIREAEKNFGSSRIKIEAVRTQSTNISKLEKSHRKLVNGALDGYHAVLKTFDKHGLVYDSNIRVS